ncbi:MAG: hypothetical protein SFV22_05535 [Saprospiraceae bacterium]|nr:hypothetical protein [Saprospiraceae bacterium]
MQRIILYKLIGNRWHYVRLTERQDMGIGIETGCCGQKPDNSEITGIPSNIDRAAALRQEGEKWIERGYGKPHPHSLQVMTLHFQMRRWTGYPAGAPWYDDWTSGYLDPIQQALDETCNGIPRGNERFSGNYLHYYTVFNTDLAQEAVEKIAAAAPVKFLLDIHIAHREKQVHIPIDPNVPEYLRSLFRVVEKSARTIAHELPVLFPADPLQAEFVPDSNRHKRIIGPEAARLRHELKEKWHFDSNFWNPLTDAAPSEVVFLNGMSEEKKQVVAQLLAPKLKAPLYLLDCETGLFEIGVEEIFLGAHEGMVFDAGLDWVIYFSHHYTITFGGDWLVAAIRDIYREQPELLNAW